MLLSVLFWFYVVLVVVGMICHLALPIGTKRSDYSLGSKIIGLSFCILGLVFYYLIYQTGII